MTNKMKKSLLVTSLLATSFLTFGAVSSLKTVETEAGTADFVTTVGASVRINEPNGIRFRIELSEAKYNEVFAENSGKTLGMYIVSGNNFGQDYSTVQNKVAFSFTQEDLYKVGSVWYANGVLSNLFVQTFTQDLMGVGYIYDGTNYEYSTVTETDNVRSMADVAIEAYQDPKVDLKDQMSKLLEKAVYAEYGVVETRTTEGDTVTYSFAKGETKWDSYTAMQADLPISLSVNEKDLFIGETLNLNPSLTVNGAKVTGLEIPFEYSVDSNAVTLENGVLTGATEGEANVTVSFGNYAETVTVNVTEKANVVFNPADANASSQITYSTVNNTHTFVPANGTLADETYAGAYMRTQPKNTGWFNISLTQPKYEKSTYENYDYITAWLYIESNTDESVNVLFLNDENLTQAITPNQWAQVKIARSRFMEKVGVQYFCAINYSTATAINIGKIVAENYDETTDLVFDPTVADSTKISANKSATITFTQASQNTDTTYGGSYAKVAPNGLTTSNSWVNISIAPIKAMTAYSNYTYIKVWVYVEMVKTTEITPSICGITYAITTNQWTEIDIPVESFAQPLYGSNFKTGDWGITKVYIGEVVGVNYERTPNVVFDPTMADANGITFTDGNGNAFATTDTTTLFTNVLKVFVPTSQNTDERYGGAYLRIRPNNLVTNAYKYGRIYVTPKNNVDAYSNYTHIKVWVYAETGVQNNSTNVNVSGTNYVVTSNQWNEIEIPLADFFANPYFGQNFHGNTSWGLTGLRIGEAVAIVK